MEVVKGRGYVYSIQYHIVWCVKYRRDVSDVYFSLRFVSAFSLGDMP